MAVGLADVNTSVFADWPLELGRIEERHGLTFVYPLLVDGFSIKDYRKIPGENRIELWGGVAVVYPEPDRRSLNLVGHLYDLLAGVCPAGYQPYLGPMDVPINRSTVFAPDLLVLSQFTDESPAIVVELRRNTRQCSWRARFRGYARAGVKAHWLVDPGDRTIIVHELEYNGREVTWHRMNSVEQR